MLLWYPSSECHLARFPRLIWRFALHLLAIDRLRGIHDFFGGCRTLENWGVEMKEIGVGLRVASGKQAVLGMKFWFCVGIREIPLVFALILTVPIVSLEKWVSPLPEAKIQWKSSFLVLWEIKIHSKSSFPHWLSPKSSISVLRERNIHLQSSIRDCRVSFCTLSPSHLVLVRGWGRVF